MIIYGENVNWPEDVSFGQYILDRMRVAPEDDVCLLRNVQIAFIGHAFACAVTPALIARLRWRIKRYSNRATLSPSGAGVSLLLVIGYSYAAAWSNNLENGLTGDALTYKEATQFTVNLAVSLLRLGVKQGDVVAIGSEYFLYGMPTILAISLTGAITTYFHLQVGGAELGDGIQLTKPKYLICSSLFWQRHENVLNTIDCIVTYIAASDIPEMSYSLKSLTATDVEIESFKPVNIQGKTDIAFIFFSSGTTGMPKGVEVTHYGCIARCFPTEADKRFKRTLVLSMCSGAFSIFAICRIFICGARAILTTDVCPETLLKIIQHSKVDVIISYPKSIHGIANGEVRKDHVDSLELVVCVGHPLRVETTHMFEQRLSLIQRVVHHYGLTETGSVTSALYTHTYKPGSIGVAGPGIVIKVVDPATQAILGPNQRGEIYVKGHSMFKDYINIGRSNNIDRDGFFSTGDIGYFDNDQFFYFAGRIKDMIRTKFSEVCPVDIEAVLLQHPAIADAGVIGKPDPDFNEVPVAFVVKKPGYDVTERELMDFVAAKVPSYMQLRGGVRFILDIPRNDNGKIMRRYLNRILNGAQIVR